jgi:hypothetical protein
MAIRVVFYMSIDGQAGFSYESATKFKRDEKGFLTVVGSGGKEIAQHAPGSWSFAYSYDADRQREINNTLRDLVDVPGFNGDDGGGMPAVMGKTKTREGDKIRTSPARATKKTR